MPGNTVSPTASERGGITTSAMPVRAREQRLAGVLELVLRGQRARVLAEVGRDRARGAVGQQPLAEQRRRSRSCRSGAARRRARTRRSRTSPRRRPPPRRRRSRSPASRSAPAATPRGRRRPRACSSCDGERPRRTAVTTATGTSAATEPLTLISIVRTATSSIVSTTSRVRLSPARAISCCPAHAVTPEESSPSLTTNSEAMKITVGSPKPCERLVVGEDARRPQGERDADRHDRHRHAVPDEDRHDRGQDHEGDRAVAQPG